MNGGKLVCASLIQSVLSRVDSDPGGVLDPLLVEVALFAAICPTTRSTIYR